MITTTFRRLAPFTCYSCDTTLGYTAPAQAAGIQTRAHVFCGPCASALPPLTERQSEMIAMAIAIREDKGAAPTYGEIAEAMGLSTSRIQNLAMSIRARGCGDDLHRAIYGRDPIGPKETESDPV